VDQLDYLGRLGCFENATGRLGSYQAPVGYNSGHLGNAQFQDCFLELSRLTNNHLGTILKPF